MDKPRTRRSGAGPGRGTPRARAGSRATPTNPRPAGERRTEKPRADQQADPRPEAVEPLRPRELLTWRAIAMVVVVLVVVLSSASSLRIYLDTERQNAENQQAIERSQARIDELNAQLARWDNPDYVRAQARERLGWVMPGETGYRVIGPDGKPVGAAIETQQRNTRTPPPAPWYARIWGSVNEADKPKPVPTGQPTATPPPLTDDGRTGPTPTPKPTKKAR